MTEVADAPTVGMRVVRWGLVAVGCALGAYGALLLWDVPSPSLVRIGIWVAVGVIVHDFVFAPITAVLGYSSRRLIGKRWRAPVAVAAMCTATLVLLSIPVYDTPGAKPDNPTVLDRDYPFGLWWSIAVVWGSVWVCYAIAAVVRRRRRDPADG
jgi:hypothetical protein